MTPRVDFCIILGNYRKEGYTLFYLLFWLIWPIMYATGIMGASAAFLSDKAAIVYIVNAAAGILLPLRGIWYILLARKNNTPIRPKMLVQTLMETVMAAIIIFLPSVSYPAFLVVAALYSSFHFAVQGINAYIYGKNKSFQHFIPSICQSVLFLHVFACVLFLPDHIRRPFVMSGSGYLLSILGHAYLCDLLSVLIKNRRVSDIFRGVSVTMPGFAGLGAPTRLLGTLRSHRSDKTPDVEIFFSYGKEIAGHCELCVDGRTYTYGNYDPNSRAVLQTMGNGIIFRAEKKPYIDFLVAQERTVVVYGLKLDRDQRKYFRHTLELFEKTLTPWQSEAENTPPDEYIHRVLQALNPPIYRINEGRFKTYFLPTINCVTLTANLLRGTPAGNTILPGVYTPGAYMDALHRLYLSGNNVIVSVDTYEP